MSLTQRYLRLKSNPCEWPTHAEIEATRREHAALLGIDPQGVLSSSWGLCPLPIPPPGGAKYGDNLPTRIDPMWAWHPVFWLAPECRNRRAEEDDDSYLLRLLLTLSDAGLVVEEQNQASVVLLDPFELGKLDADRARLRRYRDGSIDDDLRGFVLHPPHPDKVDQLVAEVESEIREAFDEMLAEKIDAEESAVQEAKAFFASFDPYPLVRGSDPVAVAASVDEAMVEGERHLLALRLWHLSCSDSLEDDPNKSAAVIEAHEKAALERSRERKRLVDALYESRGTGNSEQRMRNGLRAQLLSLCEESSRFGATSSNARDVVEDSLSNWMPQVGPHLSSSRSHPVCVHEHFRRWLGHPFPRMPKVAPDEATEQGFDSKQNLHEADALVLRSGALETGEKTG